MSNDKKTWALNNRMAALTPIEFAAAAAALKMKDAGYEAARLLLCEEKTPTQAAEMVGLSRQMVSHFAERVLKVRQAQVAALSEASPPGWQARIITLPAEEMQQVEIRSKTALFALSLQTKD